MSSSVVSVQVLADVANFVSGVEKAAGSMDRFGKMVVGASAMTAISSSIHVVESAFHAVHSAIESVIQSMERVHELGQLGATIGMSASAVGKEQYNAQLVGVDAGTMEQSLTRLMRNIATGNADGGLKILGLDPDSTRAMPAERIMSEIRAKFSRLGSAGEQLNAMDALGLGRSMKLARALRTDSETFRENADRAQSIGLAPSVDIEQQAEKFIHEVHKMETGWTAFKQSITSIAVGPITGLLKIVNALFDPILKMLNWIAEHPFISRIIMGGALGAMAGGVPGAIVGAMGGLGYAAGEALSKKSEHEPVASFRSDAQKQAAESVAKAHADAVKPIIELQEKVGNFGRAAEDVARSAFRASSAVTEYDKALYDSAAAALERMKAEKTLEDQIGSLEKMQRQSKMSASEKIWDDMFGSNLQNKIVLGAEGMDNLNMALRKWDLFNTIADETKKMEKIEADSVQRRVRLQEQLSQQLDQSARAIIESQKTPLAKLQEQLDSIDKMQRAGALNPFVAQEQRMKLMRDEAGRLIPDLSRGPEFAMAGTAAGEALAARLQQQRVTDGLIQQQVELLQQQLDEQRDLNNAVDNAAEKLERIRAGIEDGAKI